MLSDKEKSTVNFTSFASMYRQIKTAAIICREPFPSELVRSTVDQNRVKMLNLLSLLLTSSRH